VPRPRGARKCGLQIPVEIDAKLASLFAPLGRLIHVGRNEMNNQHEQNRACWNSWADWWRKKADQRGTWQKCHRNPELVLSPAEMRFLNEVRGKNVCVLGSGDNEVVFALAGMGATVTSIDISEKQLEVAGERAGILGLHVTFLRADVIDLSSIPDGRFDIVYTGGAVSIWISDIAKYYAEAVRILRPGGLFIVHEYHPIRQMWLESDGPTPRHRYFNRGPYEYSTHTGLNQVEFHWTTADHIQAVVDAGCTLVKVDEHGEREEKDEHAPFVPSTLPTYLIIVGRKEPSNSSDEPNAG